MIKSTLLSSYKVIERKSIEQMKRLLSGASSFDEKLARSQGGFRPHISGESELIKRVKASGYAHRLIPHQQASDSEYRDALDVGERLMTKVKRPQFNLRRLVRSMEIVRNVFFANESIRPISLRQASYSLNLSASAGYPYYKRKRTVLSSIMKAASTTPFSIWRDYPTMRSFRLQFRRSGDKIVPKIRVIYPYPGIITLMELRYVRPLIDSLLRRRIDTYATGRVGLEISENLKFANRFKKYNFTSDISAYDQNIPNELIYAAFSILRSVLKLDKTDAEQFENLASYFVSANLVSRVDRRESKHIVKTSGIPSGTGFTNLVGTIIHAVIFSYFDQKWFDRNISYICSDDNTTFTDTPVSLHTIKSIYRPWGLVPKPESSTISSGIGKIHFLGFDWIHGVRVLDVSLAINQLCYHTQFLVDLSFWDRIISRAASILFNGANGSKIFDDLFPDFDTLNRVLTKPGSYHYLSGYRLVLRSQERISESLALHKSKGWMIR